MARNVKHSLVVIKLSTVSVADALDVTGKALVCEVDSSWDGTASVSEVETKNCGTFRIAGTPAHTISGNAVVVGDLASTEVSSQQALQWLDATQTLFFAYTNAVDGSISANEVVYRTGSGYFTKVGETFNTSDKMGKWSWEFAVNGAIDFTP